VRSDHNSSTASRDAPRGYVGDFGAWGVKALYGEAFQEPNRGCSTAAGRARRSQPRASSARDVRDLGSYKSKGLSARVGLRREEQRHAGEHRGWRPQPR
jgi:hypothetical protein